MPASGANVAAQPEISKNPRADDTQQGQVIGSTSTTPGADAQVSQAPGQYDVMEGIAVQLRAQNSENNPEIKGYRWEIVEGSGGKLLNEETAVVTFYAPNITGDIETFTLKLTTEFVSGKSSSASMIVRVHKRAPQSETKTVVERRHGFNPWFTGVFGFGLGYMWNYPVYVPIYVPVPDTDLRPEELLPTNPEPLPPQEIQELPNDLQPEIVLPETVEFPDAAPLESESNQIPFDTQMQPIETEPPETLNSPRIEALPEAEVEAPSIAIEPSIETAPESSPQPDIAPPMDMPMDMPMDAGGF
jgi:hypothetical protein